MPKPTGQHALPPIEAGRRQIGAAAAIAQQVLIAIPQVEMQQIRLTRPEAERHAGAQHPARAPCAAEAEPAGGPPMRRLRCQGGRGRSKAKGAAARIIGQSRTFAEKKSRSAFQAGARILPASAGKIGKGRIIARPDARQSAIWRHDAAKPLGRRRGPGVEGRRKAWRAMAPAEPFGNCQHIQH